MSKTLKATFAYEDTDYTRTYSFVVDDEAAENCKAKIIALNASLNGGQLDDTKEFFVSPEGDFFASITAAQLEYGETEVLDLDSARQGG